MNKSADQLVEEVDDILRGIWGHLENPEELSMDILKLSVLNGGIGNHLVDQTDLERRAKTELKFKESAKKKHFVKEMAVNKAELEAETDDYLMTLRQELDRLSHNVTMLKLKRNDVDSVIDAARSRLALIRMDVKHAS